MVPPVIFSPFTSPFSRLGSPKRGVISVTWGMDKVNDRRFVSLERGLKSEMVSLRNFSSARPVRADKGSRESKVSSPLPEVRSVSCRLCRWMRPRSGSRSWMLQPIRRDSRLVRPDRGEISTAC